MGAFALLSSWIDAATNPTYRKKRKQFQVPERKLRMKSPVNNLGDRSVQELTGAQKKWQMAACLRKTFVLKNLR